MNVTGYQLRESMKRWLNHRNIANQQVASALYAFEDGQSDNIALPEVVSNFQKADEAYSRLQEVQQWYNSRVQCKFRNFDGKETTSTLAFAVKAVGGAGRVEKIWREACSEKTDRYSRSSVPERSAETIYAKRTVSVRDAMKEADKASSFAMLLRQVIARANTTTIGIDDGSCPITASELEKLLA